VIHVVVSVGGWDPWDRKIGTLVLAGCALRPPPLRGGPPGLWAARPRAPVVLQAISERNIDPASSSLAQKARSHLALAFSSPSQQSATQPPLQLPDHRRTDDIARTRAQPLGPPTSITTTSPACTSFRTLPAPPSYCGFLKNEAMLLCDAETTTGLPAPLPNTIVT
jgi:hypothetical protein